MSGESGTVLTFQQLPELRRKTEAIARFLKDQISAHLETLRPLFAPERVLGRYAGGRTEVAGAEIALAELRQKYAPFSNRPYDLPETLEEHWLTLVGSSLELHPWEYAHLVEGKPVTMSSPVRWIVNYRTNCNIAQVKAVLANKEATRPDYLRQFAVNALVLQQTLNRQPGLARLFQDMRYELKTEFIPDFQGLPVVTITAALKSFRPADDLIQSATAYSGVPAFIELLDIDAIAQQVDPLRAKMEALLK
jgi:hypothetical protein